MNLVETVAIPTPTPAAPPKPSHANLVFLYGTLMQGEHLHDIMKGSVLVDEAVTQPGFALVDLGAYPGLIEFDGPLKVEGELYSVSKQRLLTLDQIESEGWLYIRRPLPITPKSGNKPKEAMVYMLHPHIAKEFRIAEIKKMLVISPYITGVADDTIRWRSAR